MTPDQALALAVPILGEPQHVQATSADGVTFGARLVWERYWPARHGAPDDEDAHPLAIDVDPDGEVTVTVRVRELTDPAVRHALAMLVGGRRPGAER